MKKILPGTFLAVLVLAVVLAGCGGGGGGGGTPTSTPTATATPTPTPTATPTTPPGPSVQGTWRSEAAVNPLVTVIVREYLGSREMTVGGFTMTFYYYAGEIQCSVYPGGSYTITTIPSEGYHNSIYATTAFGLNYLYVRGGGESDPDRVEFEGWLSAADKAQGNLKIYDGGDEIWNDEAVFNRS